MRNAQKLNAIKALVDAGTLKWVYIPIPQAASNGSDRAPTYIRMRAQEFVEKFSMGYGERLIAGNLNDDMFWINPRGF